MRSSILLSITLLFLSLDAISQVTLFLKNEMGAKVDSVMIGKLYIGGIEKGSTKTIELPVIGLDSGHPYFNLSLIYNSEKYTYSVSPRCGTQLSKATSGNFMMELVLIPDQSKGRRLVVRRS